MPIKKHIPNSISLLNLLSGSVAVTEAIQGRLTNAAILIVLASIFDFFDGFAARLLHVKSDIGKELDSLADVISFGLAPSLMLMSLIRQNDAITTTGVIAPYLPYTALLIAAFSGLRLAKFNIDERQTESFIGLPTPANAFFILSLPFIIAGDASGQFGLLSKIAGSLPFQLALIPVSCYLLNSEIKLFALKFAHGFGFSANRIRYLFLLLALVLLLLFRYAGIPLVILSYLLISVLNKHENNKTSA